MSVTSWSGFFEGNHFDCPENHGTHPCVEQGQHSTHLQSQSGVARNS